MTRDDLTKNVIPVGWLVPLLGAAATVLVVVGIAWGTSQSSISHQAEASTAQALHLAEIDKHLERIDLSLARFLGVSPTDMAGPRPSSNVVPIQATDLGGVSSPALSSPGAGVPARR